MSATITASTTEAVITLDLTQGNVTAGTTEANVSVADDAANITAAATTSTITTESAITSTIVSATTVEIIAGAEQGPPGVAAAGVGSQFQATNKDTVTLVTGQVVASHSSGVGVVKANATDDTLPAVGLNLQSAIALAAVTIQTSGPFELADWTAITGAATLAAKAVYYLDTTAGKLTTTSPTTSPAVCHRIGKAVSETVIDIDIWSHIKL
jgi:hypothetical protein